MDKEKRKYVFYAHRSLFILEISQDHYFGQPFTGFFFLKDLVTAVSQFPLILRSSGFGLILALGLAIGSGLTFFFILGCPIFQRPWFRAANSLIFVRIA